MKNRQHRGQRQRRAKEERLLKERPKGHDFGIAIPIMYVGDLEFNRHLSAARIIGCAYGYQPSSELEVVLPSISLVGENPEPLKRAFEAFHRWAQVSDGDAVELTIVTLDEGGYILGINSSPGKTIDAIRLSDPISDPLMPMLTWAKKMDTKNIFIERLRKQSRSLVAPYFLSALHFKPGRPLNPEQTQQIDGLEPLLKFECNVLSEAEVQPNTAAAIILALHKGEIPLAPKGRPKSRRKDDKKDEYLRTPEAINQRRSRILNQNFPVTLSRLRRSLSKENLLAALSVARVVDWQFDQAVCNLVLSKKISPASPHYGSLPSQNFLMSITEAAGQLVETADAADDLSWIEVEQLKQQIILDGRALLKWMGHSGEVRDIETLQYELERRGLLVVSEIS